MLWKEEVIVLLLLLLLLLRLVMLTRAESRQMLYVVLGAELLEFACNES